MDLFQHAEDRAKAQRDHGMGLSTDHADDAHPGWRDSAYDFLVAFARSHEFFISEDVSNHSKAVGFPQPPTDRAWGSIYTRAAKQKIMVKDGIGQSLRRHASICPRWRSLIFRQPQSA